MSKRSKPRPNPDTDRDGYVAGETVAIVGSGFGAVEDVTLAVTHAGGTAEPGMGHDAWTVVTDVNGAFTATWQFQPLEQAGHDFVVTASGASCSGAEAKFRRIAAIATDKFDYRPGEIVWISGRGFLPSEPVVVQVAHVNGLQGGAGHDPFVVAADASGQIIAPWGVDPDDSDRAIFLATAVGSESGLKAITIFTDPPLTIVDDGGADDYPGQKDRARADG